MTDLKPEARAVCEHFYASHCYRGMSIRLCMLCHQPDWDDLERQMCEAVDAHLLPAAGTVTDDAGRALPAGPEDAQERPGASWRERAEAAEGKLARIAQICRTTGQVTAARIMAIIGREGDDPDA